VVFTDICHHRIQNQVVFKRANYHTVMFPKRFVTVLLVIRWLRGGTHGFENQL